jgi:hypothetical protein
MPQIVHSNESTNLADLLERVLDKGIVIAGDIKIKLVEIELLTINIRLLIASVDKAKEMGIDWWTRSPFLTSNAPPELPAPPAHLESEVEELKKRLARLEAS